MTRLIERQMNNAIQQEKDWKKDNTEVINCTHVSDVYLHDNLIARIGETWLELFDGGYQTATTKSRLNSILQAHGNGERIFSKNFQWFLVTNEGTIPFTSGMRLS